MPGSSESANRAHWESVGASYDSEWEPPAKHLLSERELDFVVRHLVQPEPAAALDVGMGNGRILERVLEATSSMELYAVDVAAAMVAVCEAKFRDQPRVKSLRLCDVATDPLPFDSSFGFISAVRVLKYSSAWPGSVARLARSLEPGGRLVFSMPNRSSVNRLARPYAVPWYQTSPRELMAVCDAAGLRVLEVAGYARLPYVAYRKAGAGPPLHVLMTAERSLERVLGRTLLARELFVAATTK